MQQWKWFQKCRGFFGFSPVVQRIEWEFPKHLIRVRFSTGLLEINSLTNKLFENYKQINMLIKTRDTLLPKLMSGQVRVKM